MTLITAPIGDGLVDLLAGFTAIWLAVLVIAANEWRRRRKQKRIREATRKLLGLLI